MVTILRFGLAILVASLLTESPASAHHSGAMFDSTKQTTLTGTVREFQWSNPHRWIQLVVPTNGAAEEWSVEMGAPIELFKAGWKRGTLMAGDRIVVIVHPIKDGTRAGSYLSATNVDGTPVGSQSK